MQSIESLKTKDSYKLYNGSDTANRDFAKSKKVILDMEVAREYLNCAPSYASELKQWFAGEDYPNPAAIAFEEIKRFHCSNVYGVNVDLRKNWGFEDVFYTQDTFQRYFAKYSIDRNIFILSEFFNHGDNPWPSVEDNIEIHLLALAITLILNNHVPLIKIYSENYCRKLDRYAVRLPSKK